jgi:hypothetical protein
MVTASALHSNKINVEELWDDIVDLLKNYCPSLFPAPMEQVEELGSPENKTAPYSLRKKLDKAKNSGNPLDPYAAPSNGEET